MGLAVLRGWVGWRVEYLEILAGLEADSFSGRDADLGSGSGIAADARLAGLDGEDAEASELDAIAFDQTLLHGFEDRVDGGFRLGPDETGTFDDALNEILFDQRKPLVPGMAFCERTLASGRREMPGRTGCESQFDVRKGDRDCQSSPKRAGVRLLRGAETV